MNKIEFMKQLETLLQNISAAEREEALQYYNDYFDDAGPENEQSVIEALGNPARVAENIKRDMDVAGYGENTGYEDAVNMQPSASDKVMIPYESQNGNNPEREHGNHGNSEGENVTNARTAGNSEGKNKMSAGMIVLIVVLCVLASPLAVAILSGTVGTLIGIITSWFALILGFGVSALALLIVFVVLAVVGIVILFSDPLVGVAVIGAGMICGGLGILFMMLTVAMAGIATPFLCRGTVKLFKKVFKKQ